MTETQVAWATVSGAKDLARIGVPREGGKPFPGDTLQGGS